MSSGHSRLRSALLGAVVFGTLLYIALASVSARSAGDMRGAQTALLVTMGLACAWMAAASRANRRLLGMLTVLAALTILVAATLIGSWSYWAARSQVYAGEYDNALRSLGTYRSAETRLATALPLGGAVPVQLCSSGILLASPAELWFGIARAEDYRHNYTAAAEAYGTALSAPGPAWNAQKRADIARMRDVALSRSQ